MQSDAACSREQGEAFRPEFGVTSLQMRLCLPLGYIGYALLNPADMLNLMAYITQYFTDFFKAVVQWKCIYRFFFCNFVLLTQYRKVQET